MKKQFTATFEDGTVKTRKSEAEYTHAYKITSTTGSVEYGFSKTYELCAKAAAKKAEEDARLAKEEARLAKEEAKQAQAVARQAEEDAQAKVTEAQAAAEQAEADAKEARQAAEEKVREADQRANDAQARVDELTQQLITHGLCRKSLCRGARQSHWCLSRQAV